MVGSEHSAYVIAILPDRLYCEQYRGQRVLCFGLQQYLLDWAGHPHFLNLPLHKVQVVLARDKVYILQATHEEAALYSHLENGLLHSRELQELFRVVCPAEGPQART
jgi:hypothetical protein